MRSWYPAGVVENENVANSAALATEARTVDLCGGDVSLTC